MKYRVVPVDQSFDLNDVCKGDGFLFVRNNTGHAARGIVALANDRDISNLLSSLQQADGSLERAPLAFGLVPFLPSSPSTFFLPHATFSIHDDGSRTLTLIGATDDDINDSAVSSVLSSALQPITAIPSAGSYSVKPATPIDTYLAAVTAARDAVRRGDIQKAVIARDIDVTSDTPFNIHGVLLRLRSSFGSSYRFCVGNMIGASPELLVQVDGRIVRSHPLAGTAPRTGDPDTDALLAAELIASTKNQIEHRVVIDMVHDTLLPHCSYLDWEAEPSIVTVANVQHLGTAIEGALAEPVPNVLQLVRALCPTPALGGSPSKEAIDLITRHEGFSRGNYGGAVGWVDADGNGTFAVTIRCAELSDNRMQARLFAGGGIVAESEPLAELAETQAKFQAMLSALIRP